ncbi:respiratory nitrate reductase subunit gamma [Actinomadura rugatobispora]|uniref:Respiratory nitrate reductase subunit gamma n=1 Tax=Actinomadura rugatobispora TaxID=1994 RepID=A0ABW0ZV42_9ACTN|nr:respiratory nitrate reductase subunit gamma [Actinomadura rugatobispora]
MSHVQVALWGVLPYMVLVLFVGGTVWRFRYDRFGITTRSTQLHESRLLRIASPLFHFGLFFVIAGHAAGLLIPESWTERAHVSESFYRLNALAVGGAAGLAAAVGLGLLIWRRVRVRAVRRATRRDDRVVYPVLAAALLAGLAATLLGPASGGYDYRLGVSVWFRSVFALAPDVPAMADAPFVFQAHALLGMALFALWPFSRLVHAFAAPLGYAVRPYVVYRSRGAGSGTRGGHWSVPPSSAGRR